MTELGVRVMMGVLRGIPGTFAIFIFYFSDFLTSESPSCICDFCDVSGEIQVIIVLVFSRPGRSDQPCEDTDLGMSELEVAYARC